MPLTPILTLAVALGLCIGPAHASDPPPPPPGWGEGPLSALRVDSLERVYPDRPPVPASDSRPLASPRGALVPIQIAVMSRTDAECRLRVPAPVATDGGRLGAAMDVYHLQAVPVEANNNGGSKTAVGVVPPHQWLAALVREAPFEVAEVLVPAESVSLKAGVTHSLLVDVAVARDAAPGVYSGAVELTTGDGTASVGFSLQVYPVDAPQRPALHSTHWFFPEPRNLTQGEPPAWWSEEHWKLIEQSGRVLRSFGQDTILTPLVDYREALIQTVRNEDGTYRFDYTRFDRWAELFFSLGFEYLEGHHTAMLPEKWVYEGVFVVDARTGEKTPLVDAGRGNPSWLQFVPLLYDDLYRHLREQGWEDRYLQHQLDEPKDGELYEKLAALAREHMPGIRTIDAINSRPEVYSPLVDIQVFALTILAKNEALAAERRGRGRTNWLYHCCSPYPPYPNRHLDERLTDSRLYPWLAYLLGAEGYLYWGANVYRGADPYRSSIGPVPNGSQNPGHPPGDNWMLYPGPEGLRGSLRMVAFREGLLDHSLLTLLSERDPEQARQIVAGIARSIADYERVPAAYHEARRLLLEALGS